MSTIFDINMDRNQGTAGPWWRSGSKTIRAGERHDASWVAKTNWQRGEANARRIARVPEMEAALLEVIPALAEIADCESHVESDVVDIARKALDAYEKQMAKGDNG